MCRLFIFLISVSFLPHATTLSVSNTASSLSASLNNAERAWLASNPVISSGSDNKYAPLEMQNAIGERDGLSNDYLNIIKSKTGLSIIDKSTNSWSKTYQNALSGDIDIITMIKETQERTSQFIFTKPYITLESAIITSKLIDDIASLTDLKGRKISVVKGYFWHELLEKNHPEIKIIPVESLSIGLQNTAFGITDAMLATFATATHYIQENSITNLKVAGIAPYKTDYGMAIRKDWPELVSIINKVFSDIPEQEHTAIKTKWMNLEWQSEFVRKDKVFWHYPLFVLLIIACGVLLLFLHLLRTQVKKRTHEIAQVNRRLERTIYDRTEALTEANKQLKLLAQKDALTGISNRRHFNQYVGYLLDNISTLAEVTIMVVDIDNFKAFNDNYGHQAGDECIIQVAKFLEKFTQRESEMVARFGGEEFILLLNRTNKKQAALLAQEILELFNGLKIPHAHSQVAPFVTLSIGVASSQKPPQNRKEIQELIKKADDALYESKRTGKNKFTPA